MPVHNEPGIYVRQLLGYCFFNSGGKDAGIVREQHLNVTSTPKWVLL